MVRSQDDGQDAYVGIYFWDDGSPVLQLFRRSGSTWEQLGSTYDSGALAGAPNWNWRRSVRPSRCQKIALS
jgi:hypothetical protein